MELTQVLRDGIMEEVGRRMDQSVHHPASPRDQERGREKGGLKSSEASRVWEAEKQPNGGSPPPSSGKKRKRKKRKKGDKATVKSPAVVR